MAAYSHEHSVTITRNSDQTVESLLVALMFNENYMPNVNIEDAEGSLLLLENTITGHILKVSIAEGQVPEGRTGYESLTSLIESRQTANSFDKATLVQ